MKYTAASLRYNSIQVLHPHLALHLGGSTETILETQYKSTGTKTIIENDLCSMVSSAQAKSRKVLRNCALCDVRAEAGPICYMPGGPNQSAAFMFVCCTQ